MTDIKVDESTGTLLYKNIRYLLIRPETIIEFQKAVEKELGDKTAQLMAKGSYVGSSRSIKMYKENFKISSKELAEFTCKIGSSLGWGRFNVHQLTDDRLIIDVKNSVFAYAYGKSDKPVCHYICGVVKAIGDIIFGVPTKTVETMCIAKKDPFCRFLCVYA